MKIVNENIVLFDQKLWIKETIYNVIDEIQFDDVKSFEIDDQNNLLIRFHDDHFGRLYGMPTENKDILSIITDAFKVWEKLIKTA